MTPTTEKAIPPRTMSPEREAELRAQQYCPAKEQWAEIDALRDISRLLVSALRTARLECDDPTRRKIDDVTEKYEGTA